MNDQNPAGAQPSKDEVLRNKIKALIQSREQLIVENGELKKQLESGAAPNDGALKEQMNALSAENAALRTQLASAAQAAAQAQAQAQAAAAQAAAVNPQGNPQDAVRIQELEAQLQSANASLMGAMRQLDEANTALGAAGVEIAQLNAQIAEMESRITAAGDIHIGRISDLQEQQRQQNETVMNLTNQLEEARDEVRRAEQERDEAVAAQKNRQLTDEELSMQLGRVFLQAQSSAQRLVKEAEGRVLEIRDTGMQFVDQVQADIDSTRAQMADYQERLAAMNTQLTDSVKELESRLDHINLKFAAYRDNFS